MSVVAYRAVTRSPAQVGKVDNPVVFLLKTLTSTKWRLERPTWPAGCFSASPCVHLTDDMYVEGLTLTNNFGNLDKDKPSKLPLAELGYSKVFLFVVART